MNREKVRWYVGAYLSDLVVRLASDSALSGDNPNGRCSEGIEFVESRYEMVACSSANVDLSWLAMYVASADDEAVGDGILFGGYVMSRIGSYGSRVAVVASPGDRRMVSALPLSVARTGSSPTGGDSCRRR